MVTIGILSLQGNFAQHYSLLQSSRLYASDDWKLPKILVRYVRSKSDLLSCHGLIIPGGESTTMRNLLLRTELFSMIRVAGNNGLPLFGVCAGVILLAKHIQPANEECLGVLDLEVERNGYGRQVHSFEESVSLFVPVRIHRSWGVSPLSAAATVGGSLKTETESLPPGSRLTTVSGVFIRAPRIHKCANDSIQVLARHDGMPVVVYNGSSLGVTFHPELKHDFTLHRFFIAECANHGQTCADYLKVGVR